MLTLHYRGAWGSPGVFTFAHAVEDADSAVAFLLNPATSARFGIDVKRVYLAGHSMGGFMAASAAAHSPRIAGLVMISAWDMVDDFVAIAEPDYDVLPVPASNIYGQLPLATTASIWTRCCPETQNRFSASN